MWKGHVVVSILFGKILALKAFFFCCCSKLSLNAFTFFFTLLLSTIKVMPVEYFIYYPSCKWKHSVV